MIKFNLIVFSLLVTITAAVGLKTCYDNGLFLKKPIYAASSIDLRNVLTDPITSVETLTQNSDEMKYQMEAFITNLQGKIIRELQGLENDAKFVVDRWTRDEVN